MKKRRRKRHRKATEARTTAHGLASSQRNLSFSDLKKLKGPPPATGSLISAMAAGLGGSIASSFAVSQRWMSPYLAAGIMLGAGSLAAYFGGGYVRVAGTSLAAAGAGQMSLAIIAGNVFKKKAGGSTAAPATAQSTPSPAPQQALPAPRSAEDGGLVLDLFRDASNDLDSLDREEWRYGTRDADRDGEADWQYGTHETDPRNYVEIELDDAA